MYTLGNLVTKILRIIGAHLGEIGTAHGVQKSKEIGKKTSTQQTTWREKFFGKKIEMFFLILYLKKQIQKQIQIQI